MALWGISSTSETAANNYAIPKFQRDKKILNLNEAFPEDFLQGFETIGRLKTFPGSPQFQTNRMHKMAIMHSVE